MFTNPWVLNPGARGANYFIFLQESRAFAKLLFFNRVQKKGEQKGVQMGVQKWFRWGSRWGHKGFRWEVQKGSPRFVPTRLGASYQPLY